MWLAPISAFQRPCLVLWEVMDTSCVGSIRELHQWDRSQESHVSRSQSQHNMYLYKLTDRLHQRFSNYVKYGCSAVSYHVVFINNRVISR